MPTTRAPPRSPRKSAVAPFRRCLICCPQCRRCRWRCRRHSIARWACVPRRRCVGADGKTDCDHAGRGRRDARRGGAPPRHLRGGPHRALQSCDPRGRHDDREPDLHRGNSTRPVPAARDRRRRCPRPDDPRPRHREPSRGGRTRDRRAREWRERAVAASRHGERAGRVRGWRRGVDHGVPRGPRARAPPSHLPGIRLSLPRSRDRHRRVHATARWLAPGEWREHRGDRGNGAARRPASRRARHRARGFHGRRAR